MTQPLVAATARPQTPREAFEALLVGNSRFAGSAPHYPNQGTWRRDSLAAGQAPFASIFSCSDSRVPPELIYDCGLGDLFTVRVAGHVIGPTTLGTLEYGIAHCHTPILVVLGHQSCGAVAAAVNTHHTSEMPGGFVRELVERVAPSVTLAMSAGAQQADAVAAEHVRVTVRDLIEVSQVVADGVAAGTLGIAGMAYSLESGRAELIAAVGDLGPHATMDETSTRWVQEQTSSVERVVAAVETESAVGESRTEPAHAYSALS